MLYQEDGFLVHKSTKHNPLVLNMELITNMELPLTYRFETESNEEKIRVTNARAYALKKTKDN